VANIRIKFAVSKINVITAGDLKRQSKNVYTTCKVFCERVCKKILTDDTYMIPVKHRLISELDVTQEYWDEIKQEDDISSFLPIPQFIPYFLVEGGKSGKKQCFQDGSSRAEVVLEQFSAPLRVFGDISHICTQISSEIAKLSK
jgi:hypothetical protein